MNETENKAALAQDKIKEMIFSGELAPGSFLQERKLSEQLQISRTPIREAMAVLVARGLLEQTPNRGVSVLAFTLDDMVELYDLRRVNDGLAVYLFALQATPEHIEKMSEILENEKNAFNNGDIWTARKCNWEFHNMYIQNIDNNRLREFLINLSELTNRYNPYTTLDGDAARRTMQQHCDILAAIRNRDATLAEEKSREHWEANKNHWLNKYIDKMR